MFRFLSALICLAASGCASTPPGLSPYPFTLFYEIHLADPSPVDVFLLTPTYFVIHVSSSASPAADGGVVASGRMGVHSAARMILLVAESESSVLPFVLPLPSPLGPQPWSDWLHPNSGLVLTPAETAQIPEGFRFLGEALKGSPPPPSEAIRLRVRVGAWSEYPGARVLLPRRLDCRTICGTVSPWQKEARNARSRFWAWSSTAPAPATNQYVSGSKA